MATVEAKADARQRTWRTAGQGAVSVAVVAAAGAIVEVATPGELVDWPAAGAAVGTAAVMAVAAYAHRLWRPPKDQ